MRKRTELRFSVGLMALGAFTVALAGNEVGDVSVTVGGAYYHFAEGRHLHNTTLPNLALAYNVDPHWALEGAVGVVNTDQQPQLGDQGVHGFLYTVDGIYRFTPYGALEPYVIGGIGMLVLTPNGNASKHSGNVNAGLGTQLFFGKMVALRGEIRDVYSTTGSAKNDYMVNFGVSFLFGTKNNSEDITSNTTTTTVIEE